MKPNEIREHLENIFTSKEALLKGGIIRSERFTGELGEYISELQLNGQRAKTTSNKGWDLTADINSKKSQRIQVKCHAKGAKNNARWTEFKDIDQFDWLHIIVLSPNYYINEMYLISKSDLRGMASQNNRGDWTVKWDKIRNYLIDPKKYTSNVTAAFFLDGKVS